HSLVVEAASLPSCLQPTAWTADGLVMAFEHRQWPLMGVQFHPESILTEHGFAILANFLRLSGLNPPAVLPLPDDRQGTSLNREQA
ncbi:MAG: glutamine amidotransferase-related protein, partial [Pirellulaceae bacterium]